MGRTRFMVVKAKELIKTAVFAVLGVIILVGWFGMRRYIQRKETKSLGKWVILLCVGLILYYVYRMVRHFPGDAPMSYYYGSVGYRVWEIIRSGRNYL